MTVEDFQKVALETAERLVEKACVGGDFSGDFKAGLLLKAMKPGINLGLAALRTQLRENPAEVYKWLVLAREELEKTLKKYEDKPES